MSKKDDLEKLILESYQITYKNNQKILVADPREKSRLRQENEENWEYIKTFLSEYTSLCEARKLVVLEDIIDIAATRFPDIAARLEAVSARRAESSSPKSNSPLYANESASSQPSSSKENSPSLHETNSLFQINYKFVWPFALSSKDQLLQFILEINSFDMEISQVSIPKHICLVLDVSGSMNTVNKYPYLLKAIPHVIDTLADNDILSIILFSGRSEAVWSGDIATSRNSRDGILQKIEWSNVKFNTTYLEPGLILTLDRIKQVRKTVPDAITRLYILTDGQLHDADACYLLNSELRRLEIEVNSFGFGDDFAEGTMRQIMEGCPGGRVKWIGDTDTLIGEFHHIGEVARNIIATDAELEINFLPNITPGEVFRFEPGRYRFDALDDQNKHFSTRLGALERNRNYTYAFEARVYPSKNQQDQVATATLRYVTQGKQQIVNQNILIKRTNEQQKLQLVNQEIETVFLILEEFRTNDPQVLMRSLQARLKLLRDENRYPEQIKLLERVIDKLAQEGTLAGLSGREKDQLRADWATVANYHPNDSE